MNGKIHNYRLTSHTIDLCLSIRNQLDYDEDTRSIICTNRQDLLQKLNDKKVSESTFRRLIAHWGFQLVFKDQIKHKKHKEHSQKGKCLEKYTVINNTVQIPKDEVTNKIKIYCTRNGIKIIRT